MLTKKYKNGFITLNAEKFSPVTQETIDREIKNFEPMKKGNLSSTKSRVAKTIAIVATV